MLVEGCFAMGGVSYVCRLRLFAESVVRLSWLSVWGLCVCVCVCVRARARVCVCVFVRVFLQVKVIDVCVPAAAAAAVFISPLYARLWDAHNPDGGGQGVCVSSWGDDNPNPAHGAWREVALTVLLVVAVSVGVTEGLPLPLVVVVGYSVQNEETRDAREV